MAPTTLLQNGTLLLHQLDDSIKVAKNTDLLIEGNRISAIGKGLEPPANTTTIDCTGKIISPGLIDTHHHVWQTQLKGRHADQDLIAYMSSGLMQSFSYEPEDIFWGQLSGAMEALDSGTTFILDHSHGAYSGEHAQKAMDATIASGVRSVLALSPTLRLEHWDDESIKPNMDVWPGYVMEKIEEWCKQGGESGIAGRVHAGLGFDLFFLPKEMVQGVWAQARQLGVKLITSHVSRSGALSGQDSPAVLMQSYDILKGPEKGGVKFVASHANGFDRNDLQILAAENQYISTTPETEGQMGMGPLNAFEPGAKCSLGIDCHTNNSSSILIQARAALQLKRQETGAKVIAKGGVPAKLRGSTTEAFNLATIDGARAVGMDKEIGSLEVGKKADIVIFDYENSVSMLCAGDYDPLVSVLRHSDARDIDTVIVEGIIRKQDGKLLDVDVDGSRLSWKDVAKKTRQSQVAVAGRINKLNLHAGDSLLKQMWQVDESKLLSTD